MFSENAVSDVSLSVDQGEVVAIAAPSGAGKSTLARLMCGVASPTGGRVLKRGVPVSVSNLESAGIRIVSVMQDDVIYTGAIRRNIQMFRPGGWKTWRRRRDRPRLTSSSSPCRCGTKRSPAIAHLRSRRQRQRIRLARALFGKPELLVLDEATSHLDLGTERCVLDGIRSLGAATVVFAHRPETLKAADRMLPLDNGRLQAA